MILALTRTDIPAEFIAVLVLIDPAKALAICANDWSMAIVTVIFGRPAKLTVTVPPGTGIPHRPIADDGLTEKIVPGAPEVAHPLMALLGSWYVPGPNAPLAKTPGAENTNSPVTAPSRQETVT